MNVSENTIITRTCGANEIIFHQGETGRHVYLILTGTVEIYKTIDGRRQLVSRLGSGEIFGELCLLINEPRCATAVAVEQTRLIVVGEQPFNNALLNSKLPIVKPLTKQLAYRLKETDAMLQESQRRIRQLELELTRFA